MKHHLDSRMLLVILVQWNTWHFIFLHIYFVVLPGLWPLRSEAGRETDDMLVLSFVGQTRWDNQWSPYRKVLLVLATMQSLPVQSGDALPNANISCLYDLVVDLTPIITKGRIDRQNIQFRASDIDMDLFIFIFIPIITNKKFTKVEMIKIARRSCWSLNPATTRTMKNLAAGSCLSGRLWMSSLTITLKLIH